MSEVQFLFFAMEFQIITGTRRGELPPLTWNDVDEDGIRITQSQISHENDFYIVGHTKNHHKRKFPMTADLQNLLERIKEMHDKYYPNNKFLFPAETKNGTITNMAVYGVYRRVCNKLGIPISKDVIRGPHSFRRNAITDVANATNGNKFPVFEQKERCQKPRFFQGISHLTTNEASGIRNPMQFLNPIRKEFLYPLSK